MQRAMQRIGLVIAVILALAAAPVVRAAPNGVAQYKSPVACASLFTLRRLASRLTLVRNPRTGDTFEYVVVGDAAKSSDLIVLFPGTGETIPDWPIQMLTNRQSSPLIAGTLGYVAKQDSAASLCHDYRLVLFDYPGVGMGSRKGPLTGDRIANDVDAMLDDIGVRYRIPTNVIDPLGWSLGTHLAEKFALDEPASNPGRSINNIILIATRPGGGSGAVTDGNQAACIVSMLTAAQSPHSRALTRRMDMDLFRLTFASADQPPFDGVDSGCHATVDAANQSVALTMTPDCPMGSECRKSMVAQIADRLVWPWRRTDGISHDVFNQERDFDLDWNVCWCPTAGPDFTSTGCTCSAPPRQSARNGGVCQTATSGAGSPNDPVTSNCAHLTFTGRLTVINGRQDLYVQWTYGRALVRGMQQSLGPDKARLVTYPGSAGHGVLMQFPAWTQQQIEGAMTR